MPEMRFRVRWPDQSESLCYSPSLIIKDYFNPGQSYSLLDFIKSSQEALNIASDRVRLKYGYTCSSAMSQLADIEATAARFIQTPDAQVLVIEFIE